MSQFPILPHPLAAREVESPLGEERVVDQPEMVEETSVNPELNEPSIEDIAMQPIDNNSSFQSIRLPVPLCLVSTCLTDKILWNQEGEVKRAFNFTMR
jgi:hypothetical protein